MNSVSLFIIAVAAMGSTGLLYWGTRQLGRIQATLEKINLSIRNGDAEFCHGPPPFFGLMGSPAGYAIYVYRDGKWVVEADLSRPGFEATPPSMRAAYEGQVVKRESSPKRLSC